MAWAALGADLSGVWKTSYRNEEGQTRESDLTLKQEGGKLTGTISSPRGKVEIRDGSVEGERISFRVVRVGNGDEIPITFSGKIEGGVMKLKMQLRDRVPIEMTARRAM